MVVVVVESELDRNGLLINLQGGSKDRRSWWSWGGPGVSWGGLMVVGGAGRWLVAVVESELDRNGLLTNLQGGSKDRKSWWALRAPLTGP